MDSETVPRAKVLIWHVVSPEEDRAGFYAQFIGRAGRTLPCADDFSLRCLFVALENKYFISFHIFIYYKKASMSDVCAY